MARAYIEEFFIAFRFAIVRGGETIDVSSITTIPGGYIEIRRALGERKTLAQLFHEAIDFEVFALRPSLNEAMAFNVSYDSIEWLPFAFDASSDDIAYDCIRLSGAKVTPKGIIKKDEWPEALAEACDNPFKDV